MMIGFRIPLLFALLVAFLPLAALDGDDLSVGWISRLPKIEYVWESDDPAREGWPEEGQQITWVANVRNLTNRRLENIGYRWTEDGVVIEQGVSTLEPGVVTRFDLPWIWTFDRHQISFEIDTTDTLAEIEERNNRLLIFTDAISAGFWVEQSFWEGMRQTIVDAGIGGTTVEDWLQRRILQYNDMAALAAYDWPETPAGVLDRWRIDAIHIVPDGALPIVPPDLGGAVRDWGAGAGSYATLYPHSLDRTVDMQWGFPASNLSFYANYDAWTLTHNSLVHELGHARWLIDVYAWRLRSTDVVEIDSFPPPDANGRYYETPEFGMMNTQWGYIDRYSAVALNRIAGHRATSGHYNEPWNMGAFLNDLPEENRIRLGDREGNVFPGRTVKLYRPSSELDPDFMDHPYWLRFDGQADFTLQTDEEGVIVLPRNPFSDEDLTMWVDRNNALAVLELIDGDTRRWAFLEARHLNMAYWRGETETARVDLLIDPPICRSGLGSHIVGPGHEALVTTSVVTFSWPMTAGHDYELWWSVDNGPPRSAKIDALFRNRTASVTQLLNRGKRVAWWYVDLAPGRDPLCPPDRSSTYFFDLDVPDWKRSRAVRRR
ncbi:MAG TPA: CARDB domain-containing protein [Thermoanaerobaculia bacterium]|nr:CARDB domain-containing protein [Thermoanaerobaculia bacterium]